jgi:hypothetical protein
LTLPHSRDFIDGETEAQGLSCDLSPRPALSLLSALRTCSVPCIVEDGHGFPAPGGRSHLPFAVDKNEAQGGVLFLFLKNLFQATTTSSMGRP